MNLHPLELRAPAPARRGAIPASNGKPIMTLARLRPAESTPGRHRFSFEVPVQPKPGLTAMAVLADFRWEAN